MYEGEENKKDDLLSASQRCFQAVECLFTESRNEQGSKKGAGRAGRGKGSTHTPFAHGLILREKGRSTFFGHLAQHTWDSATSHANLQRSQ